jgi:hypothetical protein
VQCILIKLQDRLKEWIAFRAVFLDEVLLYDMMDWAIFSVILNVQGAGKREGVSSARTVLAEEC